MGMHLSDGAWGGIDDAMHVLEPLPQLVAAPALKRKSKHDFGPALRRATQLVLKADQFVLQGDRQAALEALLKVNLFEIGTERSRSTKSYRPSIRLVRFHCEGG